MCQYMCEKEGRSSYQLLSRQLNRNDSIRTENRVGKTRV